MGLVDFDSVEGGNDATGLLLRTTDEGHKKTPVVPRELERLGMKTEIIERRFDDQFKVQAEEPIVALAGFDKPEPRQLLGNRFARVVDGGLGVNHREFLSIAIHTFPSTLDPQTEFRPTRPSNVELTEEHEKAIERLIGQGTPKLPDVA